MAQDKTLSDPKTSNMPLAAAWMFGMLSSLLAMGIAGRELVAELQPHHSAFYRNAICLIILLPLMLHAGSSALKTSFFGRHLARNTIHFFAQWCWLFGLGVLPLAEVFSIEFSAPIWTALLASLLLGERLTRSRGFAIVLGFVGILVILRPGVAIIDPAALIVLAAAFGYAVAYVITKNLVGVESPLTVVWWMNVIQLPIGAAMSVTDLVIPSQPLWPWLALLGVSGLTSHYSMSQALKYADATVVMPFDFLRLPLAALTAWLMYSETIDPFLALGAVFILLGNWLNLKKG